MKKCDCCNNEIRVFDINHDCTLNGKAFNLCDNCSNKINRWTKGEISYSDFISSESNADLVNTLIKIEKEKQNGIRVNPTNKEDTLALILTSVGAILIIICIFAALVGLIDGEMPVLISSVVLSVSALLIIGFGKIIQLLSDINRKL